MESRTRLIIVLSLTILMLTSVLQAQRGGGGGGGGALGGVGAQRGAAIVEEGKRDLDMVLARISVGLSKGSPPPKLKKSDLKIWEDGVEQEIRYFLVEDQPLSVGFLFNLNDDTTIVDSREAPLEFLKNSLPGVEYFLIEDQAVIASFATDFKTLPRAFPPKTSSTDSIHVGLDVLKEAAYPRKILLVFSTGGDSTGILTDKHVETYALKQDVQIYSILQGGAPDDSVFLGLLSELTGGQSVSMQLGAGQIVESLAAEFAQQLRTQYLVGYLPTNSAKDGKWRRQKVEVVPRPDLPKLKAWTKTGYYALKSKVEADPKK